MKFQPLFNFVAVKLDAAKEKTEGGIIIPDAVKSSPDTAEVVAVGEGCKDFLKEGDKVLVIKGVGNPVNIEGVDCLVLRCDESHSEILAIL